MKTEPVIEIDEAEVDEFDDYQYEITTELAQEFINCEILPILEEFDHNNPNEEYIPGVATFGLYLKLVGVLLSDGFEPEQLIGVINEFGTANLDSIVH